jgi:hypothetical protein
MNILKRNIRLMLSSLAVVTIISSCQDKANDYAPALNIGGYTSSSEIAPESLVAYWSFNGTATDSVSKTDGVGTGVSFTKGIKGQALQGALNGYVVSNTPAAVQTLKSFTATLWFNSDLNSNGIVGLMDISNSASFWGNMTIYLENGGSATTGKLKIHVDNGKAANMDAWLGNYDLTNPWNKWNQVAVTFDEASSTFNVYFNGSNIATSVMAGYGPITFNNATKMVFGTVHFQTDPSLTTATGKQDWASYLTGKLDEVRIYNKALTADEISSLQRLEARGK